MSLPWIRPCLPKRPTFTRPTYRPHFEALEDRTLPTTFTVTTLADTGAGSLRAAIVEANATLGRDTINFAVAGTIVLQSALPDITDNLDILGPGADTLTIQRDAAAPQFSLFINAMMNDLDLHGLTLSGGSSATFGGAIQNYGCLCIEECVLSGNSAPAGYGGAIYTSGSGTMLEIHNSVLTNNSAIYGGAIYAQFTTVTICHESVIADNSALNGAGVYNYFSAVSIDRSTFRGNSAQSRGGGIYSSHAPLTIAHSTIVGNSAVDGWGGGVYIAGFQNDRLNVVNTTFSGNYAGQQGGALFNGYFDFQGTIASSTIAGNQVGSTGQGGGIFIGAGTGSLVLFNTIVAGNTKGTVRNDIEGLFSQPALSSFNLIGDGSLSNLVHGVNGNLVGSAVSPIDALLGPLADNGGPTLTMALLPGSPAIDAGSNSDAPATDQRGLARVVNGRIDIGAFETQQTGPAPHVTGTAGNDTIIITPTAAGTVAVTLNGAALGTFTTGELRIDGLGGSDTVSVQGSSNADAFTIASSGVAIDNFAVRISAVNVEAWNVDGGNGNDTFTIQGNLPGLVLDGGADNDSFLLTDGGSFNGLIVGGDGTNTLRGDNVTNAWTLSGANAGSLNSAGFGGIANLTGGTAADSFLILAGGTLSGTLSGGSGSDTLDYSSYGSAITINLATAKAPGLNKFSSIENHRGGGSSDTLVGTNSNVTWQITGSNAGKAGSVSFTSFENLIGGSKNDIFKLSNGAGVSGRLDGGLGVNWLDYSLNTSGVSVNLTTGAATGAGVTVANFVHVIGGAGNDTLTGNSGNNILVGRGGNDTLAGVGGRNILIGSQGADTISGGSGQDILIGGNTSYDAKTSALNALMAEWARTDLGYQGRIDHLRGSVSGGLNGSYKLTSSTVKDDATADLLTGMQGLDWFWGLLAEISDREAGELVN